MIIHSSSKKLSPDILFYFLFSSLILLVLLFVTGKSLASGKQFTTEVFGLHISEPGARDDTSHAPPTRFLKLLDRDSLNLLDLSLIGLGDTTGEVDFSHPAMLQRTIEVLSQHRADRDSSNQLTAEIHNDLALTLATDMAYILSAQTHDLSKQRSQFLELLRISEAELERTFGSYKFSPEGEAKARETFDAIVKDCLSYFDTPRLAALSRPRTADEMANLMVITANEMQNGTRSTLEQMFAPEIMANRTPESSQRYRDLTLNTISGGLASNPFMLYVVDGMIAPDQDPQLNLIANTVGIHAGRRSLDGELFIGIRYSFSETEAQNILNPPAD